MTEEIFFIFVKVVEPPSLLSSVFGALSMFGIVVEVGRSSCISKSTRIIR